jgi:peptidoglycan/LPS O-acetylase OafA/YrhL
LLVVLFHLGGAISSTQYFGITSFGTPFTFGYAGVDFFFVLSGFIITWVHLSDIHHPDRFWTYLQRRLIRIYPVYWLVFCVVYAAAFAVPSLRSTVPHDAGTLLKALLLVPLDSHVVGGSGAPVIIVAWTLQYEMFFYAIMGLFVVSLPVASAAAALILANFGYCHLETCSFPQSFLASNFILVFAIGAIVAIACKRGLSMRRPVAMAIAGAGALLLLALFDVIARRTMAPPDLHLAYGAFSGVVVMGLVRAEQAGSITNLPRPLLMLGNASYSLYLVHYPLISVLCKLTLVAGLSGLAWACASYLGILAACIAVAVTLHLAVEKPSLKFLGNLAKTRRGDYAQSSH